MTTPPEPEAVVSLDAVLPPEPVYDVPPPPKREVPTSKESAEAIEESAAKPKRGRPPKSARTTRDTTPPPKKGAPKAPLTPKDFRADLVALTDGLWIAGSALPPAAPYAMVLKSNQAGLVEALNAGANQSHAMRGYVEKIAGGGNVGWQLQLGMVALQMGMQSMQLSKDPALREAMVAANAEALGEYMKQFQTPEAAAQAA